MFTYCFKIQKHIIRVCEEKNTHWAEATGPDGAGGCIQHQRLASVAVSVVPPCLLLSLWWEVLWFHITERACSCFSWGLERFPSAFGGSGLLLCTFLGPARLELRACSQDLQGCEVQGCVSKENSWGSIKAGRKQGVYAYGCDVFVSCSCLLQVFSLDTLRLHMCVRGPHSRACWCRRRGDFWADCV